MPNAFALINESWSFSRKQPVLLQVGFWLLFVPMLVMNLLSSYLKTAEQTITNENIGPITLAILSILALTVIVMWGTACLFVVGGRLLAAKSGRNRTSFKAVRTEAMKAIIPLLLTNILRGIFTLLWTILLIIPGIIYALNTAFYGVTVVLEGVGYRAALKRSNTLMKGKKASIYTTIILLSILLFLPSYLVEAMIVKTSPLDSNTLLSDLVSSALYTVSLTLFSLCLIQLYGSLLPKTKPVTGGKTAKATVKKKVTKKKVSKE